MREKLLRSFFAVSLLGFFASVALADNSDWQLINVGGKDYLSIDNVARFYRLKLDQDPTDHHYTLTDEQIRVETCKNPREVFINGVKHWLSFPTLVQDGRMLISRFDLAKTLEPSLRPTMIGNLVPFSTVVLDAGHGGQDGGGRSPAGMEKQYTLDVTRAVKRLLEAKGLKVVLTRGEDVYLPLENRADLGNHVSDAIFVSLHFNSSGDPGASGFEVFAMTPRGATSTGDVVTKADQIGQMPGNDFDNDSLALAACVHHSLLGHMAESDRGIKRARFAVLRLTHAPAILVEGGFLTNGTESRSINDPEWREKLAEAVAVGIKSYRDLATFKQPPKLVAEYKSEQLPMAGTILNPASLAAVSPSRNTTAFPVSNPATGR